MQVADRAEVLERRWPTGRVGGRVLGGHVLSFVPLQMRMQTAIDTGRHALDLLAERGPRTPPRVESGEECQFAEVGSHDGEVSPVERGDLVGPQSLGGADHRCVDGAEREIAVPADELGDAHPVGRCDRLDDEVAGSQVAQESDLGVAAEAAGDEARDFGDDEGRDDERAGVGLQQLAALGVVAVYATECNSKRSPSALVTFRMVDHVGLPSADSAL